MQAEALSFVNEEKNKQKKQNPGGLQRTILHNKHQNLPEDSCYKKKKKEVVNISSLHLVAWREHGF